MSSRPPFDPWSPLMAPWLQAMRLWSNAAMQWVPPGAGTDWMQQLSQVMPGAYPATGMAARGTVVVRLSSRQPAEVSLHLEPGAERLALRVDPLAPEGSGSEPAVTGATLEYADGRLRLAVSIPDTQPAASYFGLVRDAAGGRRGEIRVEVLAA